MMIESAVMGSLVYVSGVIIGRCYGILIKRMMSHFDWIENKNDIRYKTEIENEKQRLMKLRGKKQHNKTVAYFEDKREEEYVKDIQKIIDFRQYKQNRTNNSRSGR